MNIIITYLPLPGPGNNGTNRSTLRARLNGVSVGRVVATRFRKVKREVRVIKKAPRATLKRSNFANKQSKQSGSARPAFFMLSDF
jgi:hypothetical protein